MGVLIFLLDPVISPVIPFFAPSQDTHRTNISSSTHLLVLNFKIDNMVSLTLIPPSFFHNNANPTPQYDL